MNLALLSSLNTGIFVFVTAAFGLIIGSFLNVLIWRLPRELSINGRSKCPQCSKVLRPQDLIPLLSYILYRGKCRYCSDIISPRYPIIEFATGLIFGIIALLFIPETGLDLLVLIKLLIFCSALVIIFVVDLEHFVILDKVIFPVSVTLLLFNLIIDLISKPSSWSNSLILSSVIGAVVAAGLFYLIWLISKGSWIGFGDVKLGLLLGVAFGFPMVLITLFLGFLIGTAVSIPLLALNKKGLKSELPLGTFLSVAALLVVCFGPQILHWYLNLIGWYM